MFVTLPYKELIYSLRGFSGDFFVLDELEFENNLDRKIFEDCFGESNLDNLKKLCSLAVQHRTILDYIQLNQVTCCNYKKNLVIGIKNSLKEFYDELNYLEDKKDHFLTLCAFHSLFKYQSFFSDLVQIIKQINIIFPTKLFEILLNKLKSTDLYIRKYFQIKAFLKDLWNWLVYGYLNDDNKFFIEPSTDKREVFKFKESDLFCLDLKLLKRILMHDSLEGLSTEYMELVRSEEYRETQLTKFIKNATDVLFKFYSIHLIEKQKILNHLKLIKDTHLMGNHSFWMSFCADLVKKIEIKKFNIESDLSLKDVNNCWLKNIREFYAENEVNQIQNRIQIHEVQNSTSYKKIFEKYKKFDQYSKLFFFPEFSITYNFPEMIRLFICKDTFKKYDLLFNFLLKLHQTRMVLNKLWFENMKNRNYDKRICIITMELTSLIEKLLFHYKVYIIEIAYCEFENEVKNINDPTDLEQCHAKFIDRLLKESLINIEGVRNQFFDLFAFCQKVYLSSQREISNKEFLDLQSDLNDLNSHLSLLFSNVKAHEISSSLKYLLN